MRGKMSSCFWDNLNTSVFKILKPLQKLERDMHRSNEKEPLWKILKCKKKLIPKATT
jgi:hypothetical protein